jgi:hypothetical protein
MQDLHRDFAALGMHGVRDFAVLVRFSSGGEFSRKRFYAACAVRRVAARDDQADFAPCALGKIGREAVVLVAVLESGVHGAHEHPVLQCDETEVEGSEKVGVLGVGHGR